MILEILPFNSMGDIALGMSLEKIKKLINNKNCQEIDNGIGINLIYPDMGVGFYFNDSICINMGCYAPACPVYNSRELLSLSYREVLELFKGSDVYVNEGKVLFVEYGLEFTFLEKGEQVMPDSVQLGTRAYTLDYLDMYTRMP